MPARPNRWTLASAAIVAIVGSFALWCPPEAEAGVGPAPFANANGPYTLTQQTALVLNGTGGCGFGGCANVGWDLTGDGFLDVADFAPTIPFSNLIILGVAGLGPHPITLRVTDELGSTASSQTTFTVTPASVPEPEALSLLALGAAGLAFWRRRKLIR